MRKRIIFCRLLTKKKNVCVFYFWCGFDGWLDAGTMFYFACETKEELNKWLNTVMQSATAPYSSSNSSNSGSENTSPNKDTKGKMK